MSVYINKSKPWLFNIFFFWCTSTKNTTSLYQPPLCKNSLILYQNKFKQTFLHVFVFHGRVNQCIDCIVALMHLEYLSQLDVITHSAFRIFSMVKQKLSLYERKFFPFWIIIILNNFYWYSWKKIKFVIENSVKQTWEINSISLLLKRMREALVKLSIPFIFQITGLSSLQIGIKTPLLQKISSFRLLSWLDCNLNKYIREATKKK